MENFGYKNWNDTSYDSSPRTGGSSDPYGFQNEQSSYGQSRQNNNRSTGGDAYDFDITGDGDDSPEYHTSSRRKSTMSSTQASFPSRRMSTEDRMKEILERNRKESVESIRSEPPEEYISMIKSSWDDAVGVRASDASLYETLHKAVDSSNEVSRGVLMSPLSDRDDSFNISDADFEVSVLYTILCFSLLSSLL